MTNSFKYLQQNQIVSRSSYPYTAVQGSCKVDGKSGILKVKSYKSIPSGDVDGHMAALQNQPLAVAIASSSSTFMQYREGIISSSACGTSLNHAVNLVGYGSEKGKDFWILRNSWGTNWGEKGYFRVARSSKDGPGICGILKMTSYPIL
jgi:C1A family cysteine protease